MDQQVVESLEQIAPVRDARVQQTAKFGAILEAGIHALAMEWHDGMSGVADQQEPVAVVPVPAAHRAEDAGGVREKTVGKPGDERRRTASLVL